MTLVAGVDSSTQSCKVVIVDAATGAIVRSGRAAHPVGTEVDPEAWWDALRTAIASAGGLDGVAAISVGAQQHGMVVLDHDGRVIRPALLWNDTRSAQGARDLSAEFPDIAQRTGSVPVASFTSTKLRWLRDTEPANARRVAAVALPHDWLTWRLRGYGPDNPQLDELTTDRSDASGTGYFDPTTDRYDREILAAALGHDAILPLVLKPSEPAGRVGDMVVGPGAGDNAAAALGLGARDGDLVVSIGTSGTIFAVTGVSAHDASGTVAGFADASGLFLPLVATLNAARVLDAICTLLGVDHDELGRLALQAEAGSGGLVLEPYFEGERTPNRPDATATLFGMTLHATSRPNLARSAIEGILCGLADGLEALRAQGVASRRLLLIGGAAQNPAVSFIAAQVFDLPVSVPSHGDYVAIGAALQSAWVLSGVRPDWGGQGASVPESSYHPAIHEQYTTVRS